MSRWTTLPRLALAPVARAQQGHDRDHRPRRRGGRDDALDLHPAEGLAAQLGADRRRRIRPHHRRVHDRAGGHARPGPGGRHRRHPDRQGHLGRPRRRPRRRRHGHRAQVHGTDPPQREPAAAAENQPQRHGRRGRTRQRQGPHRGRRTTSRSPRPNPTSTSTPSSAPSTPTPASTSSCSSPAAPRASAAAATSLGNALRRLQPFSHYIADLNRAVAAPARGARQRDPRLRPADHRTRPPRRRDRTLGHLLQGRARQLRQPAELDPGNPHRIPLDPAPRPNRPSPAPTPSPRPPARPCSA